jgi:hypothetical protein
MRCALLLVLGLAAASPAAAKATFHSYFDVHTGFALVQGDFPQSAVVERGPTGPMLLVEGLSLYSDDRDQALWVRLEGFGPIALTTGILLFGVDAVTGLKLFDGAIDLGMGVGGGYNPAGSVFDLHWAYQRKLFGDFSVGAGVPVELGAFIVEPVARGSTQISPQVVVGIGAGAQLSAGYSTKRLHAHLAVAAVPIWRDDPTLLTQDNFLGSRAMRYEAFSVVAWPEAFGNLGLSSRFGVGVQETLIGTNLNATTVGAFILVGVGLPLS